jgi:gliding motility-associated-like protein
MDPDMQVSGISCSIFDRWGDLIFQTKSLPVAWDGVFNGKGVGPGVFVYVFQIEKENRETQVLSGDITLVR